MRYKFALLLCILFSLFFIGQTTVLAKAEEKSFIKWIDFNPTVEVLNQAYNYDKNSYGKEIKLNWIELLAYTACRNGNNFSNKKSMEMDKLVKRLEAGEKIEEITANLKYYNYYLEGYTAILGEYVGEYKKDDELCYGLKAFCPIAKGYWFNHYRDFGVSRSYGFKRDHLGNDLMGSVGTPVVAVEGGIIEELGWNRYGGWRIGVSSFDRNRYYYYAHLRKNKPYVEGLEKGMRISAGEHIGYLGNTGYSRKENVNMSGKPHLHFGIQIIFDESQRTGNKEIWINPYHIIEFLKKNRAAINKQSFLVEDYFFELSN